MKTITLYPSLENVMDDFNQYVDSFFNDFRGSHSAPASRLFGRNVGFPVVDLRDTENAYIMDVELPGYDEKSIQVHVDNNRLTIESVQREETADGKEEGPYLIKERRNHSFSRVFQLPANVDPSAITAAFKNGVLNLEIKKRPESQKRLIQINS
ncbi:MAG: Hsp20/alpha crystallin family protein [Treponema sp.]|jgi:HSP20 family protein|nr:Hsp20/alpha crystallin family protein [Treponema sp.]